MSNECGTTDYGLSLLLRQHQVKRIHASYIGVNKTLESQWLNGEVELYLTPQGNLAEKIRAGGAGIPAFYSPTGVGTWLQDGKVPVKYAPKG